MRFLRLSALMCAFATILPAVALGQEQSQSFESLIEGILGRGQDEQPVEPQAQPQQWPPPQQQQQWSQEQQQLPGSPAGQPWPPQDQQYPAQQQWPQDQQQWPPQQPQYPGEQPLPQPEGYPPQPGQQAYPGQQPAPTLPPNFNAVDLPPRPYTPPKLDPEDMATEEPAPSVKVYLQPQSQNDTAEANAPSEDQTAPTADTEAPAAASGGTAEATDATAAETPPGEPRARESLTADEVNAVVFPEELQAFNGADPLVLKAQVMLDRAGASPGAIDAYAGGNLRKAVAAVETVLGLPADGVLDKKVWDALGGDEAPPVLVSYTITPEDLAYPFTASIPSDPAEQARLPSLDYGGPLEMLSERFHMDAKLLRALNPEADFGVAGTTVTVTAVDSNPITAKLAQLVADKALSQLRGYDAGGRLIVAYPATIGSDENPSPFGNHQVRSVVPDPVYTAHGGDLQPVQLPPGPNNPVGAVWIDLTDPGYGIHGSAEPTTIGKKSAYGCVQLTNWDAKELADLVTPGVIVSFQ